MRDMLFRLDRSFNMSTSTQASGKEATLPISIFSVLHWN